ncbi:S24 family peptidase [Rouxiella sp. T17]|uniref:helix-turn-helix domain-containing protein n=1 Tax=Rouxiella sp. T17 TaxID=3085684 RepID=UPI002FCA999C
MNKQQRDKIANLPKLREKMGTRIYALRKKRNLSQRLLADEVGVSSVTISHWEHSNINPRGDNLIALSLALGCTSAYLMYGFEIEDADAPVASDGRYANYLLLNRIQAGVWQDSLWDESLKKNGSWIASDVTLGGEGFWLRIVNNAMSAASGLSVPEGTLVLFDTERKPENGDLVLIKFKLIAEPLFRQLLTEGGVKYLKALNPAWPICAIDAEVESICVAVEARLRLTF